MFHGFVTCYYNIFELSLSLYTFNLSSANFVRHRKCWSRDIPIYQLDPSVLAFSPKMQFVIITYLTWHVIRMQLNHVRSVCVVFSSAVCLWQICMYVCGSSIYLSIYLSVHNVEWIYIETRVQNCSHNTSVTTLRCVA